MLRSKKLFLFFISSGLIAVTASFSCAPSPKIGSLPEYKKPSCHPDESPSPEELDRQKSALFELIQNSDRYNNSEQREESLIRYKNWINAQSQSACPQDVERMIDRISKFHEEP